MEETEIGETESGGRNGIAEENHRENRINLLCLLTLTTEGIFRAAGSPS